MQYDFNTPVDRKGTGCVKWDAKPVENAMWVADMDFPAAPEILDALRRRVDHGVFGYALLTEDWYRAYMDWWRGRHGLEIERDWLIFCSGIVPAISSIVRKLAAPDENVVLQTPVYNAFFNCIANSGRRVLESPLIYRDGEYSIDFGDLEAKLADPRTALLILCNPHNPIGKLWDRETLERIGELCFRHRVTVVADEIHCDLTEPGRDYVPFASVSPLCRDISITCLAPTKAFNLAGLQTAAVAAADPALRQKVRRGISTDGVGEPGVLAVTAAVAAFTKGGPWLDALREHVSANRRLAAEFLARELPRVRLISGEATYLLWLDTGLPSDRFAPWLLEKTGLWLCAGEIYGEPGQNFLRMNIACPRSSLEDGLRRLKRGFETFA